MFDQTVISVITEDAGYYYFFFEEARATAFKSEAKSIITQSSLTLPRRGYCYSPPVPVQIIVVYMFRSAKCRS